MKKLAVLAAIALSFGAATRANAFTHPGIPLSVADLDTVKANLNTEPWKAGYAALQADGHSSLSYTMQGPYSYVNRNNGGNYDNESQWKNDMQAIFNLSLMWYFTGNSAYAQKAHDILLAWATTQTSFGGIEASFDIGDYAYCYAGGADILRGTWSGWSAADTTAVQNYFNNVFWPCLGFPGPMATGSQGMEPLLAAAAISVFDDDQTKFNQVLAAFLSDADAGLRDTLPNGEVGDTGRDQGHTSLFINDLALIGEILWKQGVDVFSVLDNRILAASEYYARYNLPGTAPAFVNFGAPFWGTFWSISGAPRSSGQSRRALNIIHGAYVVRKGLCAPWSDLYCNDQDEDGNSFVFRKSADISTATPPTMPTYPPTATVTTGFTNADINGCSPAGSGSYANGTWTLVSGYSGQDPWGSAAPTVHFAYKPVTGDFTMVAEVTSVANVGNAGAKGGIMLRDLVNGTASNQAWIAIAPRPSYERGLIGWTALPYGSNAASLAFGIQQLPYWVKMERVGNRIQTFTSPNGGDWSPAGTADYANMPATVYVGLFGTSLVSGTSSAATFTNVCLTGGDGLAPATAPSAPFSVVAAADASRVQLHWNEAFGATSYNVKRSTTSGGGYSTIATVSGTTYTDTAVANGTTYYYVVTATNSAGESGNSLEDSATPQAAMVNVAVGGVVNSDDYNTGGEGPAEAFDVNPGSKWYHGAAAPAWLSYDFGSSLTQTIKRYAITSANDVPQRDPAAWQLQGSNDGSSWTTLDTRSGETFAYRYQTKTYAISNATAYRYYRLYVTANSGGSGYGVQLSELALLTDTGSTVPNGAYRLLNRNSGKALDVSGGGTADGTNVQQWGYGGYANQKWTLTYLGNGQYQVLGLASGKALDVYKKSTANGANIDIWTWNGGTNQKWIVTPTGSGYFKLTSVRSGKVANVDGGSTADGANVNQYQANGGANQQWSISIAP